MTEDWLKFILGMGQFMGFGLAFASIPLYSSCWGDHKIWWSLWITELGGIGIVICVISTVILTFS